MERQEFTELWQDLEEEDIVPLGVTGNSMYPFLRNQKDMVYLKKIKNTNGFKKGDILLFMWEDGKWILHRVWKIRKNGTLLMNGDGQSKKETIRKEQVVAVVVGVKRGDREVSIHNPFWRGAVILWKWLYPFRQSIIQWRKGKAR